MHVLIADDDHVTVQLLSSVLKASGFELTIARDAMQAVMMAMRNPPDAVILDIGMPGGSGLRSEEHTSELQSRLHLVCRLLLEKKKKKTNDTEYEDLHSLMNIDTSRLRTKVETSQPS